MKNINENWDVLSKEESQQAFKWAEEQIKLGSKKSVIQLVREWVEKERERNDE